MWIQCQPQTRVEDQLTQVSTDTLDQGFVSFYNQFHQDTIFQKDHILFPLSGKSPGAGKDSSSIWTAQNWSSHTEGFLNTDQFDWSFENIAEGLIVEVLKHKTFPYAIERRWALMGETWQLIYYQEHLKSE